MASEAGSLAIIYFVRLPHARSGSAECVLKFCDSLSNTVHFVNQRPCSLNQLALSTLSIRPTANM